MVGGVDTILTSPDGENWTGQTYPSDGKSININSVAGSSSLFVAVGGFGFIFTSPDGITWAYERLEDGNFTDVVWTGSQFIISDGSIYTSLNGHDWTSHRPQKGGMRSIAWSDSQFVGVGGGGTINISPDAKTWTAQDSGTSNDLQSIVWSGSQFVVVGSKGTILTSS